MNVFHNILLTFTAALGSYVALVLLFFSSNNRLLNRLLAGFTLPVALFFFFVYIRKNQVDYNYLVLVYTFTPLFYIVPATSYLYLRTFIRDDVRLDRKDLVHALPLLLHLLYVSPLIFSLLSGQADWRSIVEEADPQTQIFNYGPLPNVFHVIFRIALLIAYLFLGFKLVSGKPFRSFVSQNKNLYPLAIRWIRYFAFLYMVLGGLSVLSKSRFLFLENVDFYHDGDWISVALLIAFDVLLGYAALHPVILFGMPHFTRYLTQHSPIPEKTHHLQHFGSVRMFQQMPEATATSTADRYTLSVAEPVLEKKVSVNQEDVIPATEQEEDMSEREAMQQLIERMDAYMSEKQPFRQKEFNISTISRDLEVPQHHIYYLFKYILKKSVVDYRNEWRVNYVIDCLKKGQHNQYTIETIGMDAGFNSKSTFFPFFKKYTGKTPLQYLAELKGRV